MMSYHFFNTFVFSPSFCIHHPSLHSFPILPLQIVYTLFSSLPCSPCSPHRLFFTFLTSSVTPGYMLTSEDLERGNTDKKEHAKSVFLDLGYFTQHDVS